MSAAPHFDASLRAWVLSRYADVAAALREPGLILVSPDGGRPPEKPRSAFTPSQLSGWQVRLEPLAREILEALPRARPIDLIGEFAEPWSLALAMTVTGAPESERERLAALAREVTASTANPNDAALATRAIEAHRELDPSFPTGEASNFIALSQTLVCVLAGGWHALLQHPAGIARLRAMPELMSRAVEEILRCSGLPGAVHRIAAADVAIGGAAIAKGDRVVLQLTCANRDAAQFETPAVCDLSGANLGHVTLGAGLHACAGAPLIRMAAAVTTAAWVNRFDSAAPAQSIEWRGGSAFRWPSALHIKIK